MTADERPWTAVNPPSLATPSGFSHAVVAGSTVHLSGQTALDRSGAIVSGGIVPQFRQALENVLAALDDAGGAPDTLVAVTIYLIDVEDYQRNGREIGRIWRELVGPWYPAMAGIGVVRLWQPEALVEIAGTAVLPG